MSTLADLWQRLGRLSRRMQLFFANDLVVAVVGLACLFGGVFIRHAHWPGGFNAAIQPVTSADANTVLDYLSVESLSIRPIAP